MQLLVPLLYLALLVNPNQCILDSSIMETRLAIATSASASDGSLGTRDDDIRLMNADVNRYPVFLRRSSQARDEWARIDGADESLALVHRRGYVV